MIRRNHAKRVFDRFWHKLASEQAVAFIESLHAKGADHLRLKAEAAPDRELILKLPLNCPVSREPPRTMYDGQPPFGPAPYCFGKVVKNRNSL